MIILITPIKNDEEIHYPTEIQNANQQNKTQITESSATALTKTQKLKTNRKNEMIKNKRDEIETNRLRESSEEEINACSEQCNFGLQLQSTRVAFKS